MNQTKQFIPIVPSGMRAGGEPDSHSSMNDAGATSVVTSNVRGTLRSAVRKTAVLTRPGSSGADGVKPPAATEIERAVNGSKRNETGELIAKCDRSDDERVRQDSYPWSSEQRAAILRIGTESAQREGGQGKVDWNWTSNQYSSLFPPRTMASLKGKFYVLRGTATAVPEGRRRVFQARSRTNDAEIPDVIEVTETEDDGGIVPTNKYVITDGVMHEFERMYSKGFAAERRPLRRPSRALQTGEYARIDELVRSKETSGFEDLHHLVYCAVVACTKGMQTANATPAIDRTANQVQLAKDEVSTLRRRIGVLSSVVRKRSSGARLCRSEAGELERLCRNDGLRAPPRTRFLETRLECLKERLRQVSVRIRRMQAYLEKRKVRAQYERCRGRRCLEMELTGDITNSSLSMSKATSFYKKLLETKGKCDLRKSSIAAWTASVQVEDGVTDGRIVVTDGEWKRVLRKTANFKATGPDGIHANWWKRLTTASRRLRDCVEQCLNGGLILPKWMATGRTVLLYKKGSRGDPANYRPITCLNNSYKLMTAVVAAMLERGPVGKLKHRCQRALVAGEWGATHALLVDSAVLNGVLSRPVANRQLCAGYIDYQKAFDSSVHKLIIHILRTAKVQEKLVVWLLDAMTKWSTKLELRQGNTTLKSPLLRFRRGVFQGDSLSPLLFVLTMLPLQFELERKTKGIRIEGLTNEVVFKHALYMDDLKVYAETPEELDEALKVVRVVSRATGMTLGLSKCARTYLKPEGEFISSSGIQILGRSDSYDYLGVAQSARMRPAVQHQAMADKCIKRTTEIFHSKLLAQQMVSMWNTCVPPIVRYGVRAGHLGGSSWSFKDDIARLDRLEVRVRGIMVDSKCGIRLPKQAAERIYLPAELGGLGKMSLVDEMYIGALAVNVYLHLGPIEMRTSIRDLLLLSELKGTRTVISDGVTTIRDLKLAVQFVCGVVTVGGVAYRNMKGALRAVTKMCRDALVERHLRTFMILKCAPSMWRTSPELLKSVGLLLTRGRLGPKMLRDITGMQERAVLIGGHPGADARRTKQCRACGEHKESVDHMLGQCVKFDFQIRRRHDNVARCVYNVVASLFFTDFELIRPDEAPKSVMREKESILYWDFPLLSQATVRHNRPDLILKVGSTWVIIEVACCQYRHLKATSDRKYERYDRGWADDEEKSCSLRTAIETERGGKKVTVIPVVVGYTGEIDYETMLPLTSLLQSAGASKPSVKKLMLLMSQCAAAVSAEMLHDLQANVAWN